MSMVDTFKYSIKRYENTNLEFNKRIDSIVEKLTIEFMEIDTRLYVQRSEFSKSTCLEICIKDTTFNRSLLFIDRNFIVTPIRALVGYPKPRALQLGDVYEDVQLNNYTDDLELIRRMFDKYNSYGRLFKRIEKELKNE